MLALNTYPINKPTLRQDFANSASVDPRLTFQRSSTATYYDGKYFVKNEENLVPYSQSFVNSSWVKTGTSVTADSFAAPDGTTSATTLKADASNGTILTPFSATAGQYTFSVYLYRKTGTGNIEVTVDGTSWTVKALSAGWNRVSVSGTLTSGAKNCGVRLTTSGDEVYLWGAQTEQRGVMTMYIPTNGQAISTSMMGIVTAKLNTPRLEVNPVTGAPLGLRVESASTNLALNSGDAGAAGVGMSVLVDAAPAPDGGYADLVYENTNTSEHYVSDRNISVTINKTYTWSFFAKPTGRVKRHIYIRVASTGSFGVIFDPVTGEIAHTPSAPIRAESLDVGGGWRRYFLTFTATSTGNCTARLQLSDGANTVYQGNGFSGCLFWGMQFEERAFPSSYIPTAGTPTTRNSESVFMEGAAFSSLYNTTEGTLTCKFVQDQNSAGPINFGILGISSGMFSRGVQVFNGGGFSLVLNVNGDDGTSQCYIAQSGLGRKTPHSIAVSWKSNDFSSCFNGGVVGKDTGGVIPTGMTTLHIGRLASVVGQLDGWIKAVSYYPYKVSDTQLKALTES